MCGVWEQANAHNDIDFLRQTVSTRRSKESEISSQLERLKQVWEQQKQQANNYQIAAENQQNLAAVRAIHSIRTGRRYIVSSLLSPLLVAGMLT